MLLPRCTDKWDLYDYCKQTNITLYEPSDYI